MLSCYYLKCSKNTEIKIQMLQRQKTEEQRFYQIVYYVTVKNQNFSNSKELVEY